MPSAHCVNNGSNSDDDDESKIVVVLSWQELVTEDSPHAKDSFKHFTYVNTFIPHSKP